MSKAITALQETQWKTGLSTPSACCTFLQSLYFCPFMELFYLWSFSFHEKSELLEDVGFSPFYSVLKPQCLGQCLPHRSISIPALELAERMRVKYLENAWGEASISGSIRNYVHHDSSWIEAAFLNTPLSVRAPFNYI